MIIYLSFNKLKLVIILSLIIFFFILSFINKYFIKQISRITYKDNIDNMKQIQNFIYTTINGDIINCKEKFYKVTQPKISIVISVYNGERFIKNALRSIQKQDFKEIEIIIVDDYSKDKSADLIKKYMNIDKRIVLLMNNKNRGALYTKTKGVLQAKGKYVMVLDVDDLYATKDAFSTLFEISEKNGLDMLGFSSIFTDINIKNNSFIYNYFETPVIFQPKIKERMFYYNEKGELLRRGGLIWCFFIKKELFIKIIYQIDKLFLNRIMNVHDDLLLFFLLTRNANRLKYIKRIFHVYLIFSNTNDTSIIKHNIEKNKERILNNCFAYLNYIEFLLFKTNETIIDKKIASNQLEEWFLNHKCKDNILARKESIKVCNLFLKNKFIEEAIKKKIIFYLNKIKSI